MRSFIFCTSHPCYPAPASAVLVDMKKPRTGRGGWMMEGALDRELHADECLAVVGLLMSPTKDLLDTYWYESPDPYDTNMESDEAAAHVIRAVVIEAIRASRKTT